MTLTEFKQTLVAHPTLTLRFVLPDGQFVPAHAHVTEVARVDKHFVDCGGTRRMDSFCRLQVWVADDTQHRLAAGKLHHILMLAAPLLPQESLAVDVEYEAGYIAQFPLETVAPVDGELHLRLGVRHTDCLAPDKCGVTPAAARPRDFSVFPVRPATRCC
jgi:hypothetical protein